MSRRSAGSCGPSPGTISVCCLGPAELRLSHSAAGIPAALDRYTYRAPADIAGSLAEFTRYTANVYRPADGNRRFVPREEDGLNGYIARAFQIGHSLLTRDRAWSKATFDDYLLSKLAYDWLCHIRQRLKPRSLTAEELVTPGYLRRDLLRRDALPDELTDGDDESSGSQRVHQIAASGAAAAARRGMEQPTETEIIALGLMDAAAGRPPLAARPEQVLGLIRDALFDFADDEAITPAVWDEISEQFEEAVRDRLYISQQQFNDWLYGKRAYVLQTIDKGAELPAAADRRALVRRAMLEEAWRGFAMVSECLDAFALAFERAVPQPLNEFERRLFRGMYRNQPHYGNLALPLLLDFKDLLEYAVLDLWEEPECGEAIEVLHRMLLYRGQIIPRVREIQRRKKVEAVLESSDPEGRFDGKDTRWAELTGHLLERRGIACPHCDLPPICLLIPAKVEGKPIKLEIGCSTHGHLRQLTITRAELVAAAEALYGDRVSSGSDRRVADPRST